MIAIVCPNCQGRGGYGAGIYETVPCPTCKGKRLVNVAVAVEQLEVLAPIVADEVPKS